MKRNVLYIFLLLTIFTLTGCTSGQKSLDADNIKVNTILVKEDGTVQSAIVGDFDKPYYGEEEFKGFVEEEITSYNDIYGKDTVTLKSFELKDGTVKVILYYKSIKDYANFNKVKAEYLNVGDAQVNENIPESFINAKDSEGISKEEALKADDTKVIVISEPLDIRVDGKVKYYSNAVLLNDTAVQSAEDGISVVVFKP